MIKSLFVFHNLLPLIFLYHIQPEIAFSCAYFLSKLDNFSTAIEDVWICFCLNNCFFSSFLHIINIKEWKSSTCWLVLVVIAKIMVISPFIVKVTYYHQLNQWWCTPSVVWDYQPHIMGIRLQNTTQTSDSLLSPTKWMVARGN